VNAEVSQGRLLFDLLLEIENRCLTNSRGLPQQQTAEETWEGVLFSVGGRNLTTPLGDVKEILNYPAFITNVPGTRDWIRGIANIRGTLLPVVDLQGFLLGQSTVPGRRSRVLVIDHQGGYSGLLVDQMVGIRHFRPSDRVEDAVGTPEAFAPYLEFHYKHSNEVWPVFSMRRLAESSEFQYAAA